MLRTFQPRIYKNLRTSQPQKKLTGPYIKKRVYTKSRCSPGKRDTRGFGYRESSDTKTDCAGLNAIWIPWAKAIPAQRRS